MSVWDEIDKRQAQYEAQLEATAAAVKNLGGGYTRLDERGFWRCSVRATSGSRLTLKLSARSSEELLDLVKKHRPAPAPERKP